MKQLINVLKELPKFFLYFSENPTCLPLPGYGQETAVDSSSWSTLISKMTSPSSTSGTTNLTTTTSATAASSDTYIASTEAFKPTLDNDTTTTGSATEATTETTTETPVPQVHGTGSGITNASTTDMDWAVTTMTPNSVTQLSVESTVTDVKAQTQLPATTEEPNVKVSAKEDEASHGRVREESDPIPRQYLTYIVAGSTFLGVPLMIVSTRSMRRAFNHVAHPLISQRVVHCGSGAEIRASLSKSGDLVFTRVALY